MRIEFSNKIGRIQMSNEIGIWFFIPTIGIDVEYKYLFIVWLNFGLYFVKD